jgi:hypothetical protein
MKKQTQAESRELKAEPLAKFVTARCGAAPAQDSFGAPTASPWWAFGPVPVPTPRSKTQAQQFMWLLFCASLYLFVAIS